METYPEYTARLSREGEYQGKTLHSLPYKCFAISKEIESPFQKNAKKVNPLVDAVLRSLFGYSTQAKQDSYNGNVVRDRLYSELSSFQGYELNKEFSFNNDNFVDSYKTIIDNLVDIQISLLINNGEVYRKDSVDILVSLGTKQELQKRRGHLSTKSMIDAWSSILKDKLKRTLEEDPISKLPLPLKRNRLNLCDSSALHDSREISFSSSGRVDGLENECSPNFMGFDRDLYLAGGLPMRAFVDEGAFSITKKLNIGDSSCKHNARSPHLRCAVNPAPIGDTCEGCSYYESRKMK